MNEPCIIAKGISKSFTTEKKESLKVLQGIDVDVPSGLISVIIGASGAGKSTLLHILGGLDSADEGTVEIDGRNIFSLSKDQLAAFRNKSIGFVFQFHHLLPEFTAAENVAIPQMIQKKSLQQSLGRARELLELVGLADRQDHKPAALSGGEQQRVAVARALANDPQIIMADEPTGNLDSKNSQLLSRLFVELRNKLNKTFLIVTHSKDLVNIADHLYEMKDGSIFRAEQP